MSNLEIFERTNKKTKGNVNVVNVIALLFVEVSKIHRCECNMYTELNIQHNKFDSTKSATELQSPDQFFLKSKQQDPLTFLLFALNKLFNKTDGKKKRVSQITLLICIIIIIIFLTAAKIKVKATELLIKSSSGR